MNPKHYREVFDTFCPNGSKLYDVASSEQLLGTSKSLDYLAVKDSEGQFAVSDADILAILKSIYNSAVEFDYYFGKTNVLNGNLVFRNFFERILSFDSKAFKDLINFENWIFENNYCRRGVYNYLTGLGGAPYEGHTER